MSDITAHVNIQRLEKILFSLNSKEKIVKSYMERHTEVSLPTLMHDADTQVLFVASGYRPKQYIEPYSPKHLGIL